MESKIEVLEYELAELKKGYKQFNSKNEELQMKLKLANESTKKFQLIAEENKEQLDAKTATFRVKEADYKE